MRHKLVGRFGRSNGDKRHAATEILASNHRLGWCAHRHAGVAALRVDYRKSGGKQRDSGSKAGRKISAQVFHFFMCLRMVSALRPSAMSPLAICCEYHTSDIFGRCLLQVAIRLPPALVHRLSIELARLAPCIARRIAGVRRGRGIDQLADHGNVNRIFAVAKSDKFGQRHPRCCRRPGSGRLRLAGRASGCACHRMRCRCSTSPGRRDADRYGAIRGSWR